MASKDDSNKCNESSFSTSSSSNDGDYSLEPEEDVSLEEEMNIPIGSTEELLIWQGRSDDADTSDDEEESPFFSDDD
jgi:hypothetical protein